MMRSVRAGSSIFARVSSRTLNVPRRSFAISAVAKADLVQDLYLKELKAYKPPKEDPAAAEAAVQKFNPPAAPKSPEEQNLAGEMQEYERQTVEIEGQAPAGETQSADNDYFEDLKDIDKEEPAHH